MVFTKRGHFSEPDECLNGHCEFWKRENIRNNEWRFVDIDNPIVTKNLNLPKFSTLYTAESFTYDLNRNDFRCGEFADIDISKPIFVVAGCSMTFGTGLPAEDTWGRILFDRLQKEFPTAQFINLAAGGTSLDFAVRTLSSLRDLKRHFDCVVTLMPEISRREFSMEDELVIPFMHLSFENRFTCHSVNHAMKVYAQTLGIDSQNNKYNLNKNLCIIDLMSSHFKFPILLDSWGPAGAKLQVKDLAEKAYQKLFISSPEILFNREIQSSPSINGLQEHLYKARDGIHPGKIYHQRYADNIYDLVKTQFEKSIRAKGKKLL